MAERGHNLPRMIHYFFFMCLYLPDSSNGLRMSDVEKAARERRKARLRSGASDRLRKITGDSGRTDFGPPVPTKRGISEPVSHTPSSLDEDDPLVSTIQEHEENAAEVNWKSLMDGMSHLSGQSAETQLDGSLFGTAQGTQTDPFQVPQQSNQQQSSSIVPKRRIDNAWNTAHLITALIVGIFVARVNPFALASSFVIAEAGLQTIRFLLGHHVPPLMLTSVSQFLPPQIQGILRNGALYLQIGRTIYRDFCVVLVVYGLLSYGGSDFARPQILG